MLEISLLLSRAYKRLFKGEHAPFIIDLYDYLSNIGEYEDGKMHQTDVTRVLISEVSDVDQHTSK